MPFRESNLQINFFHGWSCRTKAPFIVKRHAFNHDLCRPESKSNVLSFVFIHYQVEAGKDKLTLC